MMRILLVHNQYRQKGGEDQVLKSEADILKKNGHTIKCHISKNCEIQTFFQKVKVALFTAYSFKAKQKLAKILIEFKPDIVHVHNFFPMLSPSIYDACLDANIPVIQTLHNYRLICSNAFLMRGGKICEKCIHGNFAWGIFHRCYQNSIIGSTVLAAMLFIHHKKKTWQNKVDRYIALTRFGKQKFIDGNLPEKKIAFKPNFVKSPGLFTKKANSPKKEHAIFIGRLSHEKGVDLLLSAWKKIGFPLHIAGNGPLRYQLEQKTTEQIHLLGHLTEDELNMQMQNSSFLIMPSIWQETFGLVIIEAFAWGLPVIASRLGSMAEIVEDGYTGLHFNPGDVKDLREKIQFLIDHPDVADQMGKNARREYEKKYTPEKNYELLINIYKKTIDSYNQKP